MDRDTIKDWLKELNEFIFLLMPTVLLVMIIYTFYMIATRGIQ